MAAVSLIATVMFSGQCAATIWGRLANAGYVDQRITATLFFSGQALDGTNPYQCDPSPGSNLSLYTIHPTDNRHLQWSDQQVNRDFALGEMIEAGINVVNMSSWGEDFLGCIWNTSGVAPMQTSPQSHDELFTSATNKPLLIMPFIESRSDWQFYEEFPTTLDGQVAPGTVSQIVNLVNRYLINATHPEWADKWAKAYDRNGEARYGVIIIHAGSNRLEATDHAAYAAGFDAVANEVLQRTGIKVGFFIDALPEGSYAPGVFKPTPEETGPHLLTTNAFLGIESFIPEVWTSHVDDTSRLQWKRDYSQRWFQTGVPFVQDVSPGYDAHLVFGSSPFGYTEQWRSELSNMVMDYGRTGMVFNSWNGYTEGMATMTNQEYGDVINNWLKRLGYADVYAQAPDAEPPRDGSRLSPYTLQEAIQYVPTGGTVGLLPTDSIPFNAPITISKPCTLMSIGGSAVIGP